MNENMNKEQLGEQEKEAIAGGKVIESTDGKFYVVPNNSKPFSTKEDAENAEEMLKPNMFQSHPRPLPMVIPRNNALALIPKKRCEKGLMTTQLNKTPQNPIATLDIKPEIK